MVDGPITGSAVQRMWEAVGGDPADLGRLGLSGPEVVLPSAFDVAGFAAACVGVATLAVAVLASDPAGPSGPVGRGSFVTVDRRVAAAAFVGEQLFTTQGWQRPPAWDPLAGDYRAADGWIRLHTNYCHHRAAVLDVLDVLGPAEDRDVLAARVARWSAVDLEEAVVAAGGCAAVMHDKAAWAAMPAGAAIGREVLVDRSVRPATGVVPGFGAAGRPLAGVRVLDLTRVIAGPVATRFLAGYGADVLRIDPPGFAEVPALLPETTAGKRCAALDLRDAGDRAQFERLIGDAHVLVAGLRADALAALGYDDAALRRLNPDLTVASLNAYGWSGPWSRRRGFDSLVQMSCGIAAAGARAAGQDAPRPLPGQALDHGTGYLLAAAVASALDRRRRLAEVTTIHCSLAATAQLLLELPLRDGLTAPAPVWTESDTEPATTHWGPARSVPLPGRIEGLVARLEIPAGPIGRDDPVWFPV